MERYTIFLDWKNKDCLNDYTFQRNLQNECNPYELLNAFFTEVESKNITIYVETQKTLKS